MYLLSFYFLNFFPQNLLLLQPEQSHLLSIKSEKDTASMNFFLFKGNVWIHFEVFDQYSFLFIR